MHKSHWVVLVVLGAMLTNDAFAGPAVALVGAGLSISAGMAMTGFAGGLMIAGGVMSGLGAITGNKSLSKLGMVASLGAGAYQAFSNFDKIASGWSSGANLGESVSGAVDGFLGKAPVSTSIPTPVEQMGNAPSAASQILSEGGSGSIGYTPNDFSSLGSGASSASGGLGLNPPGTGLINAGLGADGGGSMLDKIMPKSDMGKMMALQAVSGIAGAPAAAQTAEATEKTANANVSLANQQIEKSQYEIDKDKARRDSMNSAKPVNMAFAGGSAYQDSDGKAINAQDHWANLFNQYFGTPAQARATA